jgi:hypothetical protein
MSRTFGGTLIASLFLNFALWTSTGQTQTVLPQAYFVVAGTHQKGCCDGGNFTVTTPTGTANFGDVGETVAVSISPSDVSIKLHAFQGGAQTDMTDTTATVYVTGPPGTPFTISYVYSEAGSAHNGTICCANVFYWSFEDFGLHPQGANAGASNSLQGSSVISGLSSTPTIVYQGQQYSFAWNANSFLEFGGGAVRCAACARPATSVGNGPGEPPRAFCRDCAEISRLDRQIVEQRRVRGAMRHGAES